MINKNHQFHIVSIRPWPLLASLQAMNLIILNLNLFSFKKLNLKTPLVLNIFITRYMWWKNTLLESSTEGFHQIKVEKGIKIGILLFITSEIFFFVSFFWAFFNSRINPRVEIGNQWPPIIIKSFNPNNVPLLNTIILLRSGFSITWAHHEILENKFKKAKNRLIITVTLGFYFSTIQAIEYLQAPFCIRHSSYGSTFFIATGFHGLHVIIGTIFLLTRLKILENKKNNKNHHLRFELATWYWHFVDIVWLFLFISIYWWGK